MLTMCSWFILFLIHKGNLLEFEHTPLSKPTGIYFDSRGYVKLYTSEFKLITYVNIEKARESLKQVKTHSQSVFQFCDTIKNRTWYSYTDCTSFRPYVMTRIRYLERLRDIVADYTAYEPNRQKRGALNFFGNVIKALFGNPNYEDSQYYTQKINELEHDQKDFLRISKDQMLIIKSTITSFNSTIRNVERNEKVLKEGLLKLNAQLSNVTISLFDETQSLAMISEHVTQIQRVIQECQEMFELIIDALIHASDGAIQPQIITAFQIKNSMKDEQPIPGLDYPVNLPSQDLMRIVTPEIYLQNKYLVYIIKVPLFIPEMFQLYQVVPFPTPGHLFNKSSSKYLYIEPAKEFIISDAVHQRFAKMTRYQVDKCIQLDELNLVCKEEFPLTSYQPGEDCEATLLHPSTTQAPISCSHRMMEVKDTLWIKLFGNEWLHVSPRKEIFTFLCGQGQEPKSMTLEGRGKLRMAPGCKGYSTHTMIFAYATISSNKTLPDIFPNIPIDLDCCLTLEKQSYLDKIDLNLPISNVLSNTDELRITSHKIEEVNEMIEEEKWRLEHSQKLQYTTWTSILGGLTFTIIITLCCSCYCCKCCRNMGKYIYNSMQEVDCTNTVKRHLCLQQTIHTGNVTYHNSTVSLPITKKESYEATATTSEPEEEILGPRTRSQTRNKTPKTSWR